MPKNFHHDPGVHARGQHEGSGCLPQVMEPNTAQTGGADQPLEVPIVIARGQGEPKRVVNTRPQSSQTQRPLRADRSAAPVATSRHRRPHRISCHRTATPSDRRRSAWSRRTSPATGAAAVSGRSPTPVMASACPAAISPRRARCTAGAPVDNAASLMAAPRTPQPHRGIAPATAPRSAPAQRQPPGISGSRQPTSSRTTSACALRVMYFRRRLPSCQLRSTTPRQRPSGSR